MFLLVFLILQLRGGDGLTEIAAVIAFVIFVNWLDSLSGVESFQSNPLPHMDPYGWFNGKYDHRHQKSLSQPPSQFERDTLHQYKSQTQLEMARKGPVIEVDKEYQKFLLIKHPETECSQERFEALCTDPQRKIIDESSIKEAIIVLEAEGRGIVKGAERPDLDNGEPNLDFKITGPGNYLYVDVKEPRNFGRGNQDLDRAARRMGRRIYDQKQQSKFGVSRNEVLHIVNFELLDPGQRADYQKNIFIPHGSEGIIIIDITKKN